MGFMGRRGTVMARVARMARTFEKKIKK